MGFGTLMVILDPEQPVYIPGQILQGYVKVVSSEEVSCKSITATIKGRARVSWRERRGRTSQHYCSEEVYFRQPLVLWDGTDLGNSMPHGEHKFPFSFLLPREIPSSFLSNFGKVIYQVKARADLPWSIDQQHKVYFSVNFLYDLNLDPYAVEPLVLEEEKTVCCLCCAQGPISLSVAAQRSGYVPGEYLVLEGEVVNRSSSAVRYTQVSLVQHITYITPSKRKKLQRMVERVYHPQLAAGGRDAWSSVPLPVPALPASHLQHCNIITIDYALELVARLGNCMKVQACAPVIIGTLPLHATHGTFLPHTRVQHGGTLLASTAETSQPHDHPAPDGASAPSWESQNDAPPPYTLSFLPDEYSDVPPPSYAACVFGRAQGRDADQDNGAGDDSDDGFAPHYLTYNTCTQGPLG